MTYVMTYVIQRQALLICRSGFFWLHQQRIQFRLGLPRKPVRRQASHRPQHDPGDVVDGRPAQLSSHRSWM